MSKILNHRNVLRLLMFSLVMLLSLLLWMLKLLMLMQVDVVVLLPCNHRVIKMKRFNNVSNKKHTQP